MICLDVEQATRSRLVLLGLLAVISPLGLAPVLMARADSRQSREEVTLMQIALAIGAGEAATGTTPTNWGQLGRLLNLDVDQQRSLLNSPAFPLQKHYIFVPPGLRMLETWQAGEVKLLTAIAVQRDHRGLGRYAIHGASNSYHRTWISEATVQEMLHKSAIALPQPEPAIVEAAEVAARRLLVEHAQTEADADNWAGVGLLERLPLGLREVLMTREIGPDGSVRTRIHPALWLLAALIFMLILAGLLLRQKVGSR